MDQKPVRLWGFSGDIFYRYKAAVKEGGIENLRDKSRSQSKLKKPR